ncbi:DUF2303 family protein [Parasutterella excrementihominis]|uniref:DUF2303 family protein n=1 Tax=Parasutterella excrementihominis TaxID=487175 RepID=UPI003A93B234
MDEKQELKTLTEEDLREFYPDIQLPEDLKAPFVFDVEGVPIVARPVGKHSWEVTDRSDLLKTPTRIKNFFLLFNDIESFCQYVKDYKTDSTNLYLTKSIKSLIFMASAVFNDIKRDQPNWRDQVAKYEPEKSIEWGDWNSNNKKRMSQIEFAEFLDEHIADIVGDGKRTPSAAEVLEAVTNLNDVRNVTFGSKVSLANGMASFVYTEKSPSGAVSEGHVSVPAEFLIGIPVFEDGPDYTIRAKLRYRIDRSSGELRLWYELQQLQRVFAKAMEAHVQKMEELLSGELPIYSGC